MNWHLVFIANVAATAAYFVIIVRFRWPSAQWHMTIIIVHSWVLFYFLLFVVAESEAASYNEFYFDETLRLFLMELVVVFASMFSQRSSFILRDWIAVYLYLFFSALISTALLYQAIN